MCAAEGEEDGSKLEYPTLSPMPELETGYRADGQKCHDFNLEFSRRQESIERKDAQTILSDYMCRRLFIHFKDYRDRI